MKQLLTFFSLAIFFVLSLAFKPSQASEVQYEELIEVEAEVTSLSPYLERRGDTGAILNVEYLTFTPTRYLSTISNNSYEDQYGSSGLTGFGISYLYKMNWQPVSIAIGPSYQMLSVGKGDNSMEATFLGASGRAVLDGWKSEPKWCPFVAGEVWRASISESSASDSFSGTIDYGYSWRVGIQILLDNLDRMTADQAYIDSGIQSTFLSVWAGANGGGLSDGDPDIDSEPELGAGLTVEF